MAIFNSYVKLPEGKLFWGNFVVVVVVVVVVAFFPGISRNSPGMCGNLVHDHPRASLLIINKHQKVMLRQESMGPNQQPSTASILLTGMDLFNNQDSISIINRYCILFHSKVSQHPAPADVACSILKGGSD
jgi:hypothetical protein